MPEICQSWKEGKSQSLRDLAWAREGVLSALNQQERVIRRLKAIQCADALTVSNAEYLKQTLQRTLTRLEMVADTLEYEESDREHVARMKELEVST